MSKEEIISTSDQNANEELSQLSFSYIAGIMLFFVFVETHGKGKLNRYTQLLFVVLLLLYPANFFAAFMIVYSTVNMINGCSKINQKSKNIKRRNFLKTSRNWNFRNFKKFLRVIKSILNVAIKICLIVLNVLWNLLLWIFIRSSESFEDWIETKFRDESSWSDLGNYGVPLLHPYVMTKSINEITNKKLRSPRNKTKFLKEIGHFHTSSKGTNKTFHNPTIKHLTSLLRDYIPEITSWKATPTTAESISRMIQVKIDREPIEVHQHWKRLRLAYNTLSEYMNMRSIELKRLSNEEVIKSINLSSSMGTQEEIIKAEYESLKFESVKDYIEYKDSDGQYLYQKRIELFKQSLEDEQPILGIFNTNAKAEKRNKNLDRASRLIWYLPATARIFEAQVFGGLEDVLKKLPYSVSGIPLYDYGEKLAEIMLQNSRKAICNDISGWDTRISYGLLCLEAEFLRNLTKDQSLKKDITNLYRLYANAHVMIDRNRGYRDETVVYKLRGQVASGRRTTYVMNTITNIVVSICAAAHSYGIHDRNFKDWMLNILFKGHTDEFGGKISGDDSVLIFGPNHSKLYAKNAHKFLNDIGLIRKNLNEDEESHIIHKMEDINFCSNNFVKVKYGINRIERWMPVKPVNQIFGKACIMLDKPKNSETKEAWARIQGLELLVYYHHIPEVKALALALLSCTNKNLKLESLSTGWNCLPKDCFQETDLLEIINKCLFGKSTKVRKFREYKEKVVKSWSDLGEIDLHAREIIGIILEEVREEWYKLIPLLIQELREPNQDDLYENWNNFMKEIKNEDQQFSIIQKLWNGAVHLLRRGLEQ